MTTTIKALELDKKVISPNNPIVIVVPNGIPPKLLYFLIFK